jgi:hypothetical protein
VTVTPTAGTVFAAAWSAARPLVFAVGGADGRVYVYDLAQCMSGGGGGGQVGGGAQLHPAEVLQASSKAVISLQFNPREKHLLASGDAEGHVKVWKLGARLSTPQRSESDRLDAFVQRYSAEADVDEEAGATELMGREGAATEEAMRGHAGAAPAVGAAEGAADEYED